MTMLHQVDVFIFLRFVLDRKLKVRVQTVIKPAHLLLCRAIELLELVRFNQFSDARCDCGWSANVVKRPKVTTSVLE